MAVPPKPASPQRPSSPPKPAAESAPPPVAQPRAPAPRLPPAAPGRGGRLHLGEMLLHAGVINQAKLDQALSMARRNNERLGSVLIANIGTVLKA